MFKKAISSVINWKNPSQPIQLGSQLAGLGMIEDSQEIDRMDNLREPGYRLSSQTVALAEKLLLHQDNSPQVLSLFALCDQEQAGIAGSQLGLAICVLAQQPTLIINTISHTEQLDKAFGDDPSSGLVGHLRNDTSLASAIQPTAVPHLSFLPFGDSKHYSPALLSAHRFQDILEKINVDHPRVILLCPTLDHDETTSLIMSSQQIVGLAMKGKTSASQVAELASHCQALDKAYTGTILTEQ